MIENCPVTGIQVRADDLGVKRVKAVETPHGTIETPCVVNCAGQKILIKTFVLLEKPLKINLSLVYLHFKLYLLFFVQALGLTSWGKWPG